MTFSFNNIYNGVNKLQLDLNNNNPTLLKNLESLLANHTLAESTYKARSENQIVLNAKNKENNIVYYLIFKRREYLTIFKLIEQNQEAKLRCSPLDSYSISFMKKLFRVPYNTFNHL